MKPATAGAAGERARLAVEGVAELQHLRRLAQLALALGLGRPGEAQRKTMLSRTVMGGCSGRQHPERRRLLPA
jgi:hypothetical protein